MNELEEFNKINKLLDYYGNLLTKKQFLIMKDYYSFNLSLSEIAEEQNITRSAVLDAINHSKEKLFYYEEKLGLFGKYKKLISILNKDKISSETIKKIEEII